MKFFRNLYQLLAKYSEYYPSFELCYYIILTCLTIYLTHNIENLAFAILIAFCIGFGFNATYLLLSYLLRRFFEALLARRQERNDG